MFLRKVCSILRVSEGVRCMTTKLPSKPVSSPLVWKYNPIFASQSLITPKKKSILDLPVPVSYIIQDVPKFILPIEDTVKTEVIEDPTKVIEQKAARLIVIRRKKMKKHKLKKLRIKMKFEWAKVRQRREMKKEKAFQAELMGQISEAEKFDAAMYAKEKISKANAVILPKLWKGKRLPEFIIKQLVDEKERKDAINKQNLERRKKMDLKVSSYKF